MRRFIYGVKAMSLMDLIFPSATEEQKLAAYIEATKLLNARIEKIIAERANITDPSAPIPILTDLEKTHILCQEPNKTTTTISMGKIHMDRVDNIKGEILFPFGNPDETTPK